MGQDGSNVYGDSTGSDSRLTWAERILVTMYQAARTSPPSGCLRNAGNKEAEKETIIITQVVANRGRARKSFEPKLNRSFCFRIVACVYSFYVLKRWRKGRREAGRRGLRCFATFSDGIDSLSRRSLRATIDYKCFAVVHLWSLREFLLHDLP